MAQTTQTGFTTTLAKKLLPGDTTMELATAPTITSGRCKINVGDNSEWIKFTGLSGSTLTGLVRGLSKTAVPATSGTGLTHPAGTVVKIVIMHDQLVDKNEETTFTGEVVATDISFTGTSTPGVQTKGLTTAQMNALDMTGISSAIIYNTTESEHYQYIGGSWSPVSAGSTQPNASETVAGKVELATDTEIQNETDTGGTGAPLVATPSQLSPAKLTDKTTAHEDDKIRIADSEDSNSAKSIDISYIREAIPASTTEKGTAELATDAEAVAGTDETRYTNPKQLKNWSGFTWGYGGGCIARSDGASSMSGTTYTKVKDIDLTNIGGTISLSFEAKDDSGGGGTQTAKIYKNGVDTGLITSDFSSTYNTYTFTDISVIANDNIQIYAVNTNGGSVTIKNFRIFATPIPNYGIPTVVL